MMFLPALVGVLLALTADARIGNSTESPFCTETKECLLYDLMCETPDYEVRHYQSVKWVSTDHESYFMEIATTTAFKRLFKYISGENEYGSKIDMTTPVITRVMERYFWEPSLFQLSFLLPAEHQKNPPKPTDSRVYFSETPDMNVYVKSYGGWTTSWVDKYQTKTLSNELYAVQAKYNKSHYAVGYNSPMTLFYRHNEVWFVADGDPVCSSTSSTSSASSSEESD